MLLQYERDFLKWAEGQGIRNPFVIIDGDNVKLPSREERDEWLRLRELYKARRYFNEIEYEEFLKKFSQFKDMDEFIPCKSKDRQCYWTCKFFEQGKCLL